MISTVPLITTWACKTSWAAQLHIAQSLKVDGEKLPLSQPTRLKGKTGGTVFCPKEIKENNWLVVSTHLKKIYCIVKLDHLPR